MMGCSSLLSSAVAVPTPAFLVGDSTCGGSMQGGFDLLSALPS